MASRFRAVVSLISLLLLGGSSASFDLQAGPRLLSVEAYSAESSSPTPLESPKEKPARRAQAAFGDRFGVAPLGKRAFALPPVWAAEVKDNLWEALGPTTIVDGQIGLTGKVREVSGRVTAVKVNPSPLRQDFWLAGTAGGGIWYTSDGGRSWELGRMPEAADGRFDPVALGVRALAFAPGGCVAYAGTGDGNLRGGGLLISDPSQPLGRSWRRLPTYLGSKDTPFEWLATAIAAIVITGSPCAADRPAPHEVWIATRPASSFLPDKAVQIDPQFLGVFRAPAGDGDLTFTRAGDMRGAFTDLQADPTKPRCLYAARVSHDAVTPASVDISIPLGIFRSPACRDIADHNARWDQVLDGPTSHANIKLAIANAAVAYASLYTPGITERIHLYRIDDIRYCPEGSCNPRLIPFNAVAKYTDAGPPRLRFHYCNWNPASSNPFDEFCLHANVLAVHPSHPNTLLAGGIALWKCTSCDETNPQWTDISYTTPRSTERLSGWKLWPPWRFAAPQFVSPRHGIHVDQQAIAWVGERLVVANDGGVWSTIWPDPRSNPIWANHNFGLAITQIYRGALDPRRPSVIFAGTQDVGTIRRDGWRWRWIQGGDGVGVVVSHRRPELHWATAHQSVLVGASGDNRLALWRTRDGGLTFERADLGIEVRTDRWVPPFVQCPAPESDVLLFGATSLWRVEHFFDIPTTRAFETASPPAWQRNYQPATTATITAVAFGPVWEGHDGRPSHPATTRNGANWLCATYAFADTQGRIQLTTTAGESATKAPARDDGLRPKPWVPLGTFDEDRKIPALAFAASPDPGSQATLYMAISTYKGTDPKKRSMCPGYIYKRALPKRLPKRLEGNVPCHGWDDVTPKGWAGPGPWFAPATRIIDQPYHALVVVPEDERKGRPQVVFAGSDFGVWMTPNDGQSWCRLSLDEKTPHPTVMDLRLHPTTAAVHAFTFGRGVFRLKDVELAVKKCKEKLP